MQHEFNSVEVWDREYTEIHSIPSSTRELPSKALRLIEPLVELRAARVLDAGCGNGRNSVYLAERGHRVLGIDFSAAALTAAMVQSAKSTARYKPTFEKKDLFSPFSLENNQFDLCLDSYVSCHFTDPHRFRLYWNELARVTKPGGMIFTSMFSLDDEYYAELAINSPLYPLVTDPINGVTKRLYDEQAFKALFLPPLAIVDFIKFQFADNVLGRSFTRSIFISLLQKRASMSGCL